MPGDWRKANVTPILKKKEGGGSGELQAGQPHLGPGEGEEANPGNHFQAHEGQEKHWKQSAWIHHGEVIFDQPDSLLQENNWVGRRGESRWIGVVYLHSSKDFDPVFHKILIEAVGAQAG